MIDLLNKAINKQALASVGMFESHRLELFGPMASLCVYQAVWDKLNKPNQLAEKES